MGGDESARLRQASEATLATDVGQTVDLRQTMMSAMDRLTGIIACLSRASSHSHDSRLITTYMMH
jgi:hypothetical protein